MSNDFWVEQLEGRVLFSGGSVDESFGTQGGVLMWHQKPSMFAAGGPSLVVQADGKILVTGYTTQGDQKAATILRLNSDGSIDTSFADQGFFRFAEGKDAPAEVKLVLQPDQKIVAVASQEMVRVDSTGKLDASFGGGDGSVGTPIDLSEVQLQSSWEIIVGGGTEVLRYTSSGALDSSFGSGGSVDIGWSGAAVSDIDVLPGDKLLVTGLSGGKYEPVVMRFGASGVLDRGFGSNGAVRVDLANNSLPWEETLVQSTGAIIVATDVGIFRYDGSGVRDPLYGVQTKPDFRIRPGPGGAWVLQPDDRLVQGTYGDYGLGAQRFDMHGILDPSFGQVGGWFDEFEYSDAPLGAYARSATLVGNKLLLAGFFGGSASLMVTRYNIDTSGPGSTGHVTGTGTLVVDGTPQADKITVFNLSKTIVGVMREDVGTEYFQGVQRIVCSAGDGNDEVNVAIDVPVTLYGGAGNDSLTTTSNDACYFDGGAGNDYLGGGAGNDTMHGGDGDDAVYSGAGNDRVFGEAGDDDIVGGSGNNTMYGGDGNDTLAGSEGRDYFSGGNGSDTADYSDPNRATPSLRLSLDGVANDGAKHERDNILTDVENVIGGPKGDYIVGNNLANRLDGLGGDDTIIGGRGNDMLIGGDGANVLSGGKGMDYVDFSKVTDPLQVSLLASGPVVVRKTETDQFTSIEGVLGGSGNDLIIGSDGPNVLNGGGGKDTIIGNGGADGIFGGSGRDKLSGGAGNDYLEGGSGDDTIVGDGGEDTMLGQSGKDLILALDGQKDRVDGGSGTDRAQRDVDVDVVSGIESFV